MRQLHHGAAMPSLDFDGEYGRTYRKSIQDSIPGHNVLHEIARAAIQATASDAQRVLVVGPGPGDELPPLLNACADAAVTVLEPSELMLEQCRKTVADHPGSSRCRLLLSSLDEALKSELKGAHFDLVVCHNVLHLMPSEEQNAMLHELTQCTADGGVLLLSSYSEAEDDESQREVFNVAWQRLLDRGVPEETLAKIKDSRNTVVFSLDTSRLVAGLKQAGWRAPVQLYQGLFIRLWLCRAGNQAEAASPET
ncbi:bifunctional 2-polyprenyl-6-hydroxyphenol methylase/3-demethylubiquinol 3-O-methyltransferase UbiG [Synechococcus sp. NOUM97013]|uniref:class I SAM-dependent methyltransferase n=1 Tax=Synechococcus sp. NOUM97013 TaxID=1442555 RepID=UPI0016455E03|nr:class I SAM-dependent methyltransferase [Synechococcus sp. NOUM97013]